MIEEIAAYIQSKIQNLHPDTGLILGSGLGDVADSIKDQIVIPYAEIPNFPRSTVAGHKGMMVIGKIHNHTVVCLQGRFHLYEGHNPQVINTAIEVLKVLGIKQLIVTNAAGSLNIDFEPGSIMMISDHINFSSRSPLVGPNEEQFGPRFPSMLKAYSPRLRNKMRHIAALLDITLHEGVYAMVLGPNFETPAEIRAFKILGGDAVGMSTVPEVICAARCKIEVIGLSVITNYGSGMTLDSLSHEETLIQSQKASADLTRLILEFLKD